MIQTIADALAERGYDSLTPVQTAVTDPALAEADLLVSAQTGSGKTVGFGLAIAGTLLGEADRFGSPAAPLALAIAPTRELALQVRTELSWLYAKAGATVISCVGGMDMRDERRALDRGAHVVVATPGRLVDHIKRGGIDMSALRAVVLDEADEMLDLGFREDLEFILGSAPEARRTLMFSATVPPAIAKLAQSFQRDAVRVQTVSERTQHADIEYRALNVAQQDTENAIINVLRYHDARNAIVFCNTRAMVNRLTARFSNRGFAVVALSGELSQTERTHALQAMRDGRARVCVATDVAARGIDLPNLELVVHAELPVNSEGLLHRSGRTGRAGRKGISALIVPPKLRAKADRLLKTARITATWDTPPSADDVLRMDEERLLADPVWDAPDSPDELAFAEKLLDLHDATTIAAAYLRLYRAGRSAPEDLALPGAAPVARPRTAFGPGVWFSLSAGRDDRAEARWILPLLCKAGNITKDEIGAIRIQQSETFVEITEGAVAGFLAAVGSGMTLEDGVALRRLDAAPEAARSPAPRPQREDRRPVREDDSRPVRGDVAPAAAPDVGAGQDHASRTTPDPVQAAPAAASPAPAAASPAPERSPVTDPQDAAAPRRKERHKPGARPATDAPRDDRSAARPAKSAGFKRHVDAPTRAAAAQADGALTEYRGKPKGAYGGQGKSGNTSGGKPGGKPEWKKPGNDWKKPGPAEKPRPDAADTSKRFTPPGKDAEARGGAGKPGAKPMGKPAGKPGFGKAAGFKSHGSKTGGNRAAGSKSHGDKPGGPRGGSAKPRRDKG